MRKSRVDDLEAMDIDHGEVIYLSHHLSAASYLQVGYLRSGLVAENQFQISSHLIPLEPIRNLKFCIKAVVNVNISN